MKKVLFGLVFLLLAGSVYALTLNDFPSEFTFDNDFITITGVKAAVIDTTSAIELLKFIGGAEDTEGGMPVIKLGAHLMDDKATYGNDNFIVIGGPCANELANELMGKPEPCAKDFEDGKAIIQLFQTGSKYGLLIAGYSGEDTKRAVDFMITKQPPVKDKIIIDTSRLEVLG